MDEAHTSTIDVHRQRLQQRQVGHLDGVRARRGRVGALLAAVVVALVGSGCSGGTAGAAPAPPAPPIPAPGTAALTAQDVDAWLDGLVPAALQRSGIAGAAVTVVRDGRLLTVRGFGYADTGSDGAPPRPVDPERTLFRIGSISKVATATAVLQLVEQGRIDLDADVGRYLDFPLPRTSDRDLTMRHLLTHTAGFEERIDGIISYDGSAVDLRSTVATDPPAQVFEPGTVPAYSNYGYALAGYVVERVTGTGFTAHVDREVLGRAGMASSTFAQPLPDGLRDRLSQGYPTADDPAGPFETVGPAPAGALTASAADMGRFMLAHLGEPASGRSLLGPEGLELMRRPGLDGADLGPLADGPRMTLGFFDERRNGHRILGHGGDTDYFHSEMRIFPDHATGVFVTLNSVGRGAADTLELRESLVSGFADRYFPPAAGDTASGVEQAAARRHAAMAEGTYEASRASYSTFLSALGIAGQTRVTALTDGTLLMAPGPGTVRPAVYREVEPWVWQEVGGQRIVTMRTVGDRVEALGFMSAFTLLRVEPGRDAAVVLPVLASSAAVLLVSLVAWPTGAAVRRRYGRAAPGRHARPWRVSRALTRIAVVAAVVALAGWGIAIVAVAGLQPVPEPVLLALQDLQWVAAVGVVPAAAAMVLAVVQRVGPVRILGSGLVCLALAGVAWAALVAGLLSPSVSY